MFQGNFCVWFVNKWWNGPKQLDRRPCNRHNQFTWFFTYCFIWFLSFNFLFSFCQSRSFHLIGTTKKCINVSIIWRTRTRPLRRSCPLEVGTLEAKSFLIWSVSVVTEKYSLTLLWGKKLITWPVMSSQLEKGKFSSDPFKGFIFCNECTKAPCAPHENYSYLFVISGYIMKKFHQIPCFVKRPKRAGLKSTIQWPFSAVIAEG